MTVKENSIDAIQWYLIIEHCPVRRDEIYQYVKEWNDKYPHAYIEPLSHHYNHSVIRDIAYDIAARIKEGRGHEKR